MIVEFDKSFSKSLDKIKDSPILKRIETAILKLEAADKIEETTNIKKLKGYTSYYRIKIGDYRVGFETIKKDKIKLIIALHRKDIYKHFP